MGKFIIPFSLTQQIFKEKGIEIDIAEHFCLCLIMKTSIFYLYIYKTLIYKKENSD